ncbi:MAG: 4-hydroxybenzoyl-CoA reductase subunit beta [Betaproteobacteria bacterium]|jgi:4-hydroxybenzoyl-CoA reductase subunit beta|nr:4-hydroxybenzoyl-CoA reductase subunit beta [Betaproteobacteria bacterium]MDH5285675.1 4-hydroxybenzoyl-CoA reductase subunit beta [Betaproteobacteria bacterium]
MDRMHEFRLSRPDSLDEAVALLARDPLARPLAGGTDLVPNLRRGIGAPSVLVDLSGVPGLDAIEAGADGSIAIGAGVTLARVVRDDAIARALPALQQAAASVAGPSHRTAATLGGNLCLDTRCVFYNQSEWWRRANDFCLKHGGDTCHVAPQGTRCHAAYSGDTAAALIALAAEAEVAGPQGSRRVPLERMFVDDGAKHLALGRGEILLRVHVPPQPAGSRNAYRKARPRGAIDFPLAGAAARVALDDGGAIASLRVALTGTNSHPLLLDGTAECVGRPVDEAMLGGLAKRVQKQAKPMRSTVTSSNWRRTVAAVLVRRVVAELAFAPG